MNYETAERLATFALAETGVRLRLSLESPWAVKPGLTPDTHEATTTAAEAAKLPSSLVDVFGAIELWTSDPDAGGGPAVTIAGVRLAQVLPERLGYGPGDALPRVLAYKLVFADFRAAFVEPRGARLFGGEVNPDPPRGPTPPRSNSDLIGLCLGRMGSPAVLPANVDFVEPMRGLSWHGAHAPGELSRLLQHCGGVYVPKTTGVGAVEMIGLGLLPDFAGLDVESDVVTPAGDRRAGQVVVTSAPQAVVCTFDEAANQPPSWKYVAQNAAGNWVPLAEVAGLEAGAAAAVRADFKDVPEADRPRVRKQAYRVVRLDPAKFPPRQSPILGEVYQADGTTGDVRLKLLAARQLAAGAWKNVLSTIPASSVDQARGLVFFDERVGRVTSSAAGGEGPDLDAGFVEVPESQLKLTFSVEAFDPDTGDCEVYAAGYEGAAATDPATAKAWMGGYRPGVACHCDPSLRLIRLNGQDVNRTELDARSGKIAQTLAAAGGGSTARVVTLRGLTPVELSGRVSGVKYDLRGLRTVVEIDGYQSPVPPAAAISGGRGGIARGGGGGASALAQGVGVAGNPRPSTQPDRSYAAADARAQARRSPAGDASRPRGRVPGPPPPPPLAPTAVRVEITGKRAEKGWYDARLRKPPAADAISGDLTVGQVGGAGAACVVKCLSDAGAGTHTLELGRVYAGLVAGRAKAGSSDLGLLVEVSTGGVLAPPLRPLDILTSYNGVFWHPGTLRAGSEVIQ